MKRIALAAALMAAFAGSAMAQSSVSLYGRINTSVEWQDNDTIDKTVMRNNASRWGLRGNEDLGGGLNAFFQLETGFGSDDGTGTGGFNRDAYVGLKSNALGQIQVGKFNSALYYATIDYIGMFNHNTGTTSEDNLYFLPVAQTNAVEYTSPKFGGFSFSLTATAGEGNINASKNYEGVVRWEAGNFYVAGGYVQSENGQTGAENNGWSVAASYGFGPFVVGASMNQPDIQGLGKAEHYALTGMWTMGALEFHGSVGYLTEFDIPGSEETTQFTLGVNYNLSKRTKLYAFYFMADNGTTAVIGTGNVPGIPQQDFSSIGVGIRHNF
ncbi:porin [Rivibacter subsaxonicus]|uniref:Putative porin n=1 Tax=Rivibacter subsaxonicus TaxID=457575 RepID=A0A4Q7VWT5_9BURK|nr:porin [Rivibacter subsaxonicus]RZU01214.1 putative porin [Rivibacter subsaxonicus]